MKACRICGVVKPLDQFPKNRKSGRKDGHRTECKECHKRITSEISKIKRESGEVDPGPDAPCACCGKTGTKKYFDHCHDEKNSVVGFVMNAIQGLESTLLLESGWQKITY